MWKIEIKSTPHHSFKNSWNFFLTLSQKFPKISIIFFMSIFDPNWIYLQPTTHVFFQKFCNFLRTFWNWCIILSKLEYSAVAFASPSKTIPRPLNIIQTTLCEVYSKYFFDTLYIYAFLLGIIHVTGRYSVSLVIIWSCTLQYAVLCTEANHGWKVSDKPSF